jgi:signal transduction histidine kinase
LSLKPVNLSKLLTTVVTSYQSQSPQPITTQLTPDLWINANPDSLKQVTLALLDNARKYAANATVTVKAQQIDQHIVMTVANTGPSIPDDAKPHLFDRFYRVDESRSSDIPGSGLGLAIVKQLVDQHHAQISVTDNVPTGAVFSITFNQLDPQFKNEEPSSNLH